MSERVVFRIVLVLGLALTALGLAVDAGAMKAWLDGRAADGTADFFTPDLLAGVRGALIGAGPLALLLPWLARLRRRALAPLEPPAPVPATAAGPLSAAPAGEKPRVAPDAAPNAPLVVATLLAAGLVAVGLGRIHTGPPLTKDAKFYLSTSLDIRDAGGVAALPGRCFTGEYDEANRHPLYPAALSLFAERSDRFTDKARLLSLAGAVTTLLLVIRTCRRAWGPGAGSLAGLLLVTNGTFLEQSVSVACESWLMAAAVLWFDFATRGRGEDEPLWHWIVVGVALALAWLLKGTGTLLLAATALFLLPRRRLRGIVPLAVMATSFAVVALPLLWRNQKLFGWPFYNVNSSRTFWLDRWKDFDDPELLHAASPLQYWETHSLAEMASRLASGLAKEALHLLEVLAPWSPGSGLGFPVCLLVLAALVLLRDRRRRALLVLVFALFFVSFAWYAKVVQGWRFLAALVPLLLLPVGALWPRIARRRSDRVGLEILASLVGAVLVGVGLAHGAASFRLDRFTPRAESEAVHAFLLEHVGERAAVHYLLGPSDSLGFDWDRRIAGTRHAFPRTEEELDRILDRPWGEVTRYAILEAPAEAGPRAPAGSRAPRIGDDWVREGADGGLELDRAPQGWEIAAGFPEARPRVLVLERP